MKNNNDSVISKLDKIKSYLNKLIIGQKENKNKNNRNKPALDKRTIRKRVKSEIINVKQMGVNLKFGFNKKIKTIIKTKIKMIFVCLLKKNKWEKYKKQIHKRQTRNNYTK